MINASLEKFGVMQTAKAAEAKKDNPPVNIYSSDDDKDDGSGMFRLMKQKL